MRKHNIGLHRNADRSPRPVKPGVTLNRLMKPDIEELIKIIEDRMVKNLA